MLRPLGSGLHGGIERSDGVFGGCVGDLAEGLAGRGVLHRQRALGAVAPLAADVKLLGGFVDDLLLLGFGDSAHALNLLPKSSAH
jgi:hypothetical protein